MGSSQASATQNKRKVNTLKQRRRVRKNHKNVMKANGAKMLILRKPDSSKKKKRKDAKRQRIAIEHEKAMMIQKGLITEEDIMKLENEEQTNELTHSNHVETIESNLNMEEEDQISVDKNDEDTEMMDTTTSSNDTTTSTMTKPVSKSMKKRQKKLQKQALKKEKKGKTQMTD